MLKALIKDKVLMITLMIMILSITIGSFSWSFINFEVIITLLGMMLVLAIFDNSGVLKLITMKMIDFASNTRSLSCYLIFFSFILSAVLSNDVAVLTVLPLYILMIREIGHFKGHLFGGSMITIAANLGGVVFPFSSPQNLIIYDDYPIGMTSFLQMSFPLFIISIIIIYLGLFFIEKKHIPPTAHRVPINPIQLGFACGLFLLMVLGILEVIPLTSAVGVVVIACIVLHPHTFGEVDVGLLLTFVGFFIIVGNLNQWPVLSDWVMNHANTPSQLYYLGIGLSQLISNVPAVMLLIHYTMDIRTLLFAVNIGGLGTIIASLANLIGLSIYKKMKPSHYKPYLKTFLFSNGILLLILTIIGRLLI